MSTLGDLASAADHIAFATAASGQPTDPAYGDPVTALARLTCTAYADHPYGDRTDITRRPVTVDQADLRALIDLLSDTHEAKVRMRQQVQQFAGAREQIRSLAHTLSGVAA